MKPNNNHLLYHKLMQ